MSSSRDTRPEFLARIEKLSSDEHEVLDLLLDRIDGGRRRYGRWNVCDGRDYHHEALCEALDGMAYLAAEIVRLRRNRPNSSGRMRRVYVCHPFAGDVPGNTTRVRAICRALADSGFLPVAPHLYLPRFLDEATERERALAVCLELVAACDEVRVYGGTVTAGMMREIERAEALGLPVRIVGAEVA